LNAFKCRRGHIGGGMGSWTAHAPPTASVLAEAADKIVFTGGTAAGRGFPGPRHGHVSHHC
jgi:hypothetical protein